MTGFDVGRGTGAKMWANLPHVRRRAVDLKEGGDWIRCGPRSRGEEQVTGIDAAAGRLPLSRQFVERGAGSCPSRPRNRGEGPVPPTPPRTWKSQGRLRG